MTKKLWGGRFSKKTNPLVEEFTRSIQYDYKLAEHDLIGSLVHVQTLKKAHCLTAVEAAKLTNGLEFLHNEVKNGKFVMNMDSEDIHTDIQNKLQKKIGDLALKLHTARSRNDQVVFAMKMYCKKELEELKELLLVLVENIGGLAGKNKAVIIPGFTHMQHAQPVYLKDYLGAYCEMLGRDAARLSRISGSITITMGAGALAGTPIDAAAYKSKAFNVQPTSNSLDAVSDRDFVIEILSALSIIGMHLSRLSEDLIIWSTKEFDFIEIDESFCTGSSLMPQKKNPDVLELIRGYAGRLYGNLINVLTTMKGIPLTYNRDMQLDKEPLFNSIEIVASELKVLTGLIKTLKFNKEKIKEHLRDESLYATDLVYYLIDLGISFTEAHTLIGKLIKYSIDNAMPIKEIPEDLLKKKLSDKISRKEIIKRFDPEFSVKSKKSVKRDYTLPKLKIKRVSNQVRQKS